MKLLAVPCLFLMLVPASFSQVPVRKDLMDLLNRVPPPPASTAAAVSEKLYASLEGEIKETEKAYETQARSGGVAAATGVPGDMAQRMQDPEFKKKMKSMSKEEKMKLAMEMMKSAPMGKPVEGTDPPEVLEVVKEMQRVNLGTQMVFEEDADAVRESERLKGENEQAHAKIDAWEAAEAKKLPQISTGEMSVAGPGRMECSGRAVEGAVRAVSSEARSVGLRLGLKEFRDVEDPLRLSNEFLEGD